MGRESYKASAPGKLMLLGEHAVLHGKLALVGAVNQKIQVKLTPRFDTKINISSEMGYFSTTLADLKVNPPFHFILSAIERQLVFINSGFDLIIKSDFSHEVGLGSSAAVTCATTAALFAWLKKEFDRQKIFDYSFASIREVQGLGSGADLAASVFGGIIAYRMKPLELQKLPGTLPITVVYSGAKEGTVKVVNVVENLRSRHPAILTTIFELMELSTRQAVAAIMNQNWHELGQLLNINQGFMDAIGVNNLILSKIIYGLRSDPGIWGSKISGAGLGDCVVGLGQLHNPGFPYTVLPLEISPDGVTID